MTNSIWNYNLVLSLIDNAIDLNNKDTYNQIELIKLFRRIDSLHNKNESLKPKLIQSDFSLSSEQILDIIEIEEKISTKNVFGYFIANEVDDSNDPDQPIINRLLKFIYSKEETDLTKTIKICFDKYVKEINIGSDELTCTNYKVNLIEKIKLFTNIVFFITTINIYRVSNTETNKDILSKYTKWIDSNVFNVN